MTMAKVISNKNPLFDVYSLSYFRAMTERCSIVNVSPWKNNTRIFNDFQSYFQREERAELFW